MSDMRGVPKFQPPNINIKPGAVLWIVLAVLAAVILYSSFFQIEPEEVGLVLTFGKYSHQVEPGLRFKLPYPIQTVVKVPIQRQLKQEFGFRTQRAGVRTSYDAGSFDDEALMLTGDLNVAVVEWITQYRVGDPYKFVFKVRGLQETFRDMTEEPERIRLLRCLYVVAAADENISTVEDNEIFEVATAIGVRRTDVVALRMEFKEYLGSLKALPSER